MANYFQGARNFTIHGSNFGDQYYSNPDARLDKLNHISAAGINASNDDDCMPGTRVDLLKELYQWSKDTTAPRVFWLDGMAGTGKSAVARSICHSLHQHSLLGGSFFCSRNDQSCANVKCILPTLAWDLARQDSKYREALLGVLKKDPDVACYTVERQVHHLLEAPFCNEGRPPPIFVVDALDECANPKEVRKLLEALLSMSPQPPVKFFITSRPEPYIRGQFSSPRSDAHRILRLHDIEKDIVQGDISLYLTRRLAAIRSTSDLPEMFPDEWPAPRDIAILTRRAGKLFIYAFTAIQYIGAHNHVERLETLTKFTVKVDGEIFRGPLDAIYTHVLSTALAPCTKAEKRRTKQILAIILAIREPLTLSDLARLIGNPPSDIRICLDRIHAVIRVPPRGRDDGIISAFHKSFVDFLTTPGDVQGNKFISLPAGHQDLARCCMEIMRSKLHFNMFRCETSYLPNSKQQLSTIPESLRYSCHHWAHHLSAASDPQTLLQVLEDFILQKFLFWLEVLSATAAGAAASLASNLIMRALKVVKPYQIISPNLVLFLQDANEFILTFRTIIDSSIPHIYLSAAPWLQQTSTLAETLKPLVQNTVIVSIQGIKRRQRLLLDLRGHTSPVNSVSFSPDGSRIVSGSDDGTVKIWDATTGEEVMNLSKAALDPDTRIQSFSCIKSVKYSPDGRHIAVATGHKQIPVLDVSMEESITELFCLEGHTDGVTSIAFSQDGKHIVSCSYDRTVRVWDMGTHKTTLTIDVLLVKMATFTPSGTHIVSCSHFGYQLWDAGTGKSILSHRIDSPLCFGVSPDGTQIGIGTRLGEVVLLDLKEEGGVVKRIQGGICPIGIASIGIAPNGAWIASSTIGRTVQVVSLETSEEVMAPLQGHTSVVLSIDTSPDGSRIVTGSKDKTVCVWDARIMLGKDISGKSRFKGFSRVCISPDARYIVARSFDGKMAVWDPWTTKEIANIECDSRHESFQLSPDGLCIVSGLQDGSVRLWNATTGSIVRTLRSHGQPVHCVGFSSDGTRVFGTLREGVIYLWDAESGEEVMKLSDMAPRSCANFSPNGKFLATAGGRITLWDVRTGQRVLTRNGFTSQDEESISFICFSPDGSRLVSCGLFTIQTWNVATGEEVMAIQPSRLLTMCLSPNGRYIVTGSRSGEVQFWDARTGEAILEVGHTDGAFVYSIAASSNWSESRIVSCSYETIRMWDFTLVEKIRATLTSNSQENDFILRFDNDNDRPLTALNPHLISHRPNDDGWIIGPDGQLILWVPPQYRPYLIFPPCVLVIGEFQVTLDFGRFAHGTGWTECCDQS